MLWSTLVGTSSLSLVGRNGRICTIKEPTTTNYCRLLGIILLYIIIIVIFVYSSVIIIDGIVTVACGQGLLFQPGTAWRENKESVGGCLGYLACVDDPGNHGHLFGLGGKFCSCSSHCTAPTIAFSWSEETSRCCLPVRCCHLGNALVFTPGWDPYSKCTQMQHTFV